MPVALLRWLWMMMFGLLLLGCGDSVEDQIARQASITRDAVMQLKQQLDGDKLANGVVLREYTQKLAQQKPQLKDLMQQLAMDATSSGPMFQKLQQRTNIAISQPLSFSDNNERLVELLDIASAADPLVFNDALSDPVNVVADLSDGSLLRVNAMDKRASETANGARDFGPGSQLIGNPAYGQWRNDSNGLSFWQWYAAYRIFDDLFDIRRSRYYTPYCRTRWFSNECYHPYSYGSWSRYRDYSYYGDYGWERYSSHRDKKSSYKVEQQNRKVFERRGQKFTSAYSKSRTGSSALSKNSSWSKSSDRFKSSYAATQYSANRSSRFSSSSSQRNSSTRTSRSLRGGK